MINVGSIGILGVSGFTLDKKGYSYVRIIKNKGLQKVSLI